jgi:hypothetical protein
MYMYSLLFVATELMFIGCAIAIWLLLEEVIATVWLICGPLLLITLTATFAHLIRLDWELTSNPRQRYIHFSALFPSVVSLLLLSLVHLCRVPPYVKWRFAFWTGGLPADDYRV